MLFGQTDRKLTNYNPLEHARLGLITGNCESVKLNVLVINFMAILFLSNFGRTLLEVCGRFFIIKYAASEPTRHSSTLGLI